MDRILGVCRFKRIEPGFACSPVYYFTYPHSLLAIFRFFGSGLDAVVQRGRRRATILLH